MNVHVVDELTGVHHPDPPAIDMPVQVFYDDIATDDGNVALVGWQPA